MQRNVRPSNWSAKSFGASFSVAAGAAGLLAELFAGAAEEGAAESKAIATSTGTARIRVSGESPRGGNRPGVEEDRDADRARQSSATARRARAESRACPPRATG